MSKIKVLNLYARIGGNRKLWANVDVTAIEYNDKIAKIYQDYFPQDKVIITDAHQYLLEHYKEYDLIWSSPPCPSHSRVRKMAVSINENKPNQNEAIYPEMSLYQEILLLRHYTYNKTKWIVENVKPYYDPLIKPTIEIDRHLFWCNFRIDKIKTSKETPIVNVSKNRYGYNLDKYKNLDKVKILRNMVNPEIGLHFLNRALEIKTQDDIKQPTLF